MDGTLKDSDRESNRSDRSQLVVFSDAIARRRHHSVRGAVKGGTVGVTSRNMSAGTICSAGGDLLWEAFMCDTGIGGRDSRYTGIKIPRY